MKTIKRLLCAALIAVCAMGTTILTSCGGKKADYTIGVLQVATHTALDAARDGFTETLTKWAADNGKTIEFNLQNAQGDSNNEKTIASNLVAGKCDLLLGIATSSARALTTATTKIPVLFTAVTDPVAGNISGDNVTGTSDMAPVAKQIDLVGQIVPGLKKIGFLYCGGEENSQKQVQLAKARCDEIGIETQNFTVTATSDIQQVVENIPTNGDDAVQAVFIPTDNLLAANMRLACDILTPKGIPVIAGEEGMCEDDEALATLSIDYKKLGVQTAEIAIRILNGEKPSAIPFEYYNQAATFVINEKNAAKLLEKNSALKISAADIEALKSEYNK